MSHASSLPRHSEDTRALGEAGAATSAPATMRSPVNWALLGLVIERPSYGYEFAQRFEQVYEDVLPISGMSHIYTALQALKTRSLIEEVLAIEVVEVEVGRQPTPHYRATARGLHAYRERLVAQRREDDRRGQLFARQIAVFHEEPEVALDVLARYEEVCLPDAAKTLIPSADDSPVQQGSELIARLTGEASRLAEGARLSWLQYARREFRALAAHSNWPKVARKQDDAAESPLPPMLRTPSYR